MGALEIVLVVVALSGLGIVIMLSRSCDAYEDEDGFHLGKPPPDKRQSVSEFEPVPRVIKFPTLVAGLAGLGMFVLALLLWP